MKLSKIIIGSMRFKERESAAELIRKAIEAGFNYIDSAPLYRFQNEEENSESWVGNAVNYLDYREKVMISSKSATSNGRLHLGDFIQSSGFGVRSAGQFSIVFQQSLKRMNIDYLDFYHLWICHTNEQFMEAFKQGGWYEGFLKEKAAGRVGHLGITTHADADTIIGFLETGYFETVTLPLNVINRTRMKAVEYCREKNIPVIAMNPLGGGFLAANEKIREFAFKYLLSLDNVHILLGFTSAEEVDFARKMQKEYESNPVPADMILDKVSEMLRNDEPRCTGCGYCQPCPQFIDIGASLSYYNLYRYLGLEDAKTSFGHLQWNARYNLNKCISCGICEKRCPNELPVRNIVQDAIKLMY